MQTNKYNGGYAGLFILLISIAIIAIIFSRTHLTTNEDTQKNFIEEGQSAIETAENLKKKIEQNPEIDIESELEI